MSTPCDLLIVNGTIVDGTGDPAFAGDVAIADGKIVAVGPGPLGYEAAKTIDATGRHVMPGWTDIHTHYDTQCMVRLTNTRATLACGLLHGFTRIFAGPQWDPLLTPSGPGGVTTVVMGNCGVGAAPTRREGREFMMNILGVVEDIPVEVMREGVQWEVGGKTWESCACAGCPREPVHSLGCACRL